MTKVLVTSRDVRKVEDRFKDVLIDAGFSVVYPAPSEINQPTDSELWEALPGVVAVVAGSDLYTAALFDAFPQLRVIARVGVGYDAIDLAAATARGIAVAIAPGTNQGSVAEHTLALMLGLTRHLPHRDHGVKHGEWPRRMSQPLRGRTLGLAGLGRIGQAVAIRARAFDMRVLAYEPTPDQTFCDAHDVTLVAFERLLAEADFLSLHLPLTPQTRGLMNRDAFAKMKPTAVLVNTSRGPLVREADLIEALRNKRLGGAALDVFEREPTPADNPLLQFENVILTPHSAGVDVQSLGDMARSAAESVVSLHRGEWPAEKIVNPEVRASFRW
jgi:D-3-phosphoglycerate dehydrogenase / 2-oxoglutarate reductase